MSLASDSSGRRRSSPGGGLGSDRHPGAQVYVFKPLLRTKPAPDDDADFRVFPPQEVDGGPDASRGSLNRGCRRVQDPLFGVGSLTS